MRQMGDGCRPVFRQFTKFSILVLEISVNFLQRVDRLITSIILPRVGETPDAESSLSIGSILRITWPGLSRATPAHQTNSRRRRRPPRVLRPEARH